MVEIPLSLYRCKISSISLRVAPTQVRCATVGMEVLAVISAVIRIVRSLVLPPAPYVTLTKSGFFSARRESESHNLCSPASSLGGKNSTEKVGFEEERVASRRLKSIVGEGTLTFVSSSEVAANARTLIASLRSQIDEEISTFLGDAGSYIESIGPELVPVSTAMRNFLIDGGKRFRPLLGAIGSMAVTGKSPDRAAVKAVASLEFLHACALIHDDVMDGSDTRRGNPSIHRRFESMHRQAGLSGDSAKYGEASAILLGDLALIWADLILHRSGVGSDRLLSVLPIYDELRVELMAGQYLDVHEQSLASVDADRSLKVAKYKSGKYSIERPLHFGARLSHGSDETLLALSRYGIPIGEAFQLRDDILGVFGDPDETGKPAGDDLREGKRTVLIALAVKGSDEREIFTALGDPHLDQKRIERLREVIISSGALAQVEEMISDRAEQAHEALSSTAIADEAKPLLELMAQMALHRSN